MYTTPLDNLAYLTELKLKFQLSWTLAQDYLGKYYCTVLFQTM